MSTGADMPSACRRSYPSWASPAIELPELLSGLERHRKAHLIDVSHADVAAALGRVGERFGPGGDPLRVAALDALTEDDPGYSPEMAQAVLDGMARDWTGDRLTELIRLELGEDAPTWAPISPAVHVSSGNVPGVSVTTLIRGLLAGSAVLLKPGKGDAALPVLFHGALAEASPEIAGAAAVHHWSPEDEGVDRVMADARLVVAYGGDDAIRWVRARTSPSARLIEYPHRLSVLVVDPRATPEAELETGARQAARAVALFDQRGCVSPHAAFVVPGDRVTAEAWADLLAAALDRLAVELPQGRRSPAEATAFHQEAGVAEMAAAAGTGTRVWGVGTGWRVVYEPTRAFEPSCLGRFVRVYPVDSLAEAADRLAGLSPHLQSVGVLGEITMQARRALIEAGALRVTRVEDLPWPPAWAPHDGVRPLRALVRWVDEGE